MSHTCARECLCSCRSSTQSATPAAVLSQQTARPAQLTSLFFYPVTFLRRARSVIAPSFPVFPFLSCITTLVNDILYFDCVHYLQAFPPVWQVQQSHSERDQFLLIAMLFSHLHTKQLERVTRHCLNSTLRNSGYIFPFARMSHKLTGHYAGCERCSCVWLSRHNTVAVFYWLPLPLTAFQLPLKCSS